MKEPVYYYSCKERRQLLNFSNNLFEMMCKYPDSLHSIAILCIGTDKVTGDSLGPFVGHQIRKQLASLNGTREKAFLPDIRIFGTLKNPVHAVNLEETLETIKKDYKKKGIDFESCLLVVVDASLGYPNHLGCVTLTNQPLTPGEGVNKKLPQVGQISVTGIIGEARNSSYKSQLSLRHTKLSDLMELADFISDGIMDCLKRLYLHLSIVYRNGLPDGSHTFFLHNGKQQI